MTPYWNVWLLAGLAIVFVAINVACYVAMQRLFRVFLVNLVAANDAAARARDRHLTALGELYDQLQLLEQRLRTRDGFADAIARPPRLDRGA